ncbi:MAG: hypothetical protein MMC23_009543 [Stictis urceolatum]|nr:hypothetical protein [Stictis urceolata]
MGTLASAQAIVTATSVNSAQATAVGKALGEYVSTFSVMVPDDSSFTKTASPAEISAARAEVTAAFRSGLPPANSLVPQLVDSWSQLRGGCYAHRDYNSIPQ